MSLGECKQSGRTYEVHVGTDGDQPTYGNSIKEEAVGWDILRALLAY
jgi:hypothetical protein